MRSRAKSEEDSLMAFKLAQRSEPRGKQDFRQFSRAEIFGCTF